MTALIQTYPKRILAIITLIGILWIMVTAPSKQSQAITSNAQANMTAPVVGAYAPDFSLLTPDGTTMKLSDLRGKGVLVNFWATWCIPCRSEMPTMQAVYTSKHAQGFEIIAVNMHEDTTTIKAYLAELGLTFPVVIDSGTVANQYSVVNIPTSFFIDQHGIIRAIYIGPMSRAVFNASLDAIRP